MRESIGLIERCQPSSPAATRQITAPKHEVAASRDSMWCGPNAVSALTGCTVRLAEMLFQAQRSVTVQTTHTGAVRAFAAHVKGTNTAEMRAVLDILGFSLVTDDSMRGESLAAWTEGRTTHRRDASAAYLVNYATHWGVVQGDWFCDNRVGLVRLQKASMRRGAIWCVHRVVRLAVIDFDRVEAEYGRRLTRAVRDAKTHRRGW